MFEVPSLSLQNDSDTEFVLNCNLNTNSYELVGSNLMPTGITTFYQTPRLDSGTFEHELTRVDFLNIQYPTFNQTGYSNANFQNVIGNNSANSTSGINQYTCSAGFDTIIETHLNYTASYEGDNLTSYTANKGSVGAGALSDTKTSDDQYFRMDDEDWEKLDSYSFEKFRSYYPGKMGHHVSGSLSNTHEDDGSNFVVGGEYGYHAGMGNFYSLCLRLSFDGLSNDDWYWFYWDCTFQWTGASGTIYGVTEVRTKYEVISTTLGEDFSDEKIRMSNYVDVEVGVASQDFEYIVDWCRVIPQTDPIIDFEFELPFENKTVMEIPTDYNGSIEYKMGGNYNNDAFLQYYDSSWISLATLTTSTTDTIVNFNFSMTGFPKFRVYFILTTLESSQYSSNFRIYIDKFNLTANYFPISNIWVENFNYSILGIVYNETIQLSLKSNETISTGLRSGNLTYYFDSTSFPQYTYTHDLVIPAQNITLVFNISFQMSVNFSFFIAFSTNEWKVPTDVRLTINGEEVIDESYNGGFALLDTFPQSLVITATLDVYFELNITIDFTLTLNFDIISKTHLRKEFTLSSNHEITIESINFDDDLILKKVYLNSIEYSATDPCVLGVGVSMIQRNTFYLDIILSESIYQQLTQVMNTLGDGSYGIIICGLTNTLHYNDKTRFDDFSFNLPPNFDLRNMNLSFSDIRYKPIYTSNDSYDTFGIYQEPQSYIAESISIVNSSTESNFYNITYETQIPANDSFTMLNGTQSANGTLGLLDGVSSNLTSEGVGGYYEANYSFTYDADGSNPKGWTVVETGGTVDVIAELDGHKKVVDLDDTVDAGGQYCELYQSLSRVDGIVEFYWRAAQTDEVLEFLIYDGGNADAIRLSMYNDGHFKYNDGSWKNLPIDTTYLADTWYHIKINFNCNKDWDVDIDQVQKGSGLGFRGSPSTMDAIKLRTGSAIMQTWIDSIGYNWTSYNVGDNLNNQRANNTLNFTTIIQFNNYNLDQIKSFNLSYAYRTNTTQLINMSIYNDCIGGYSLINSTANGNKFYLNYYYNNTRSQNFFNSTLQFLIEFKGLNHTPGTEFNLSIDLLSLEVEFLNETTLGFCPSLNIIYKNPVFVNEVFNISTFGIQTSNYSLGNITFYDNISGSVQYLGNISGQVYNITLNFTSSQYYEIWIYVNDTSGAWINITISDLFIRKKACFMDLLNLRSYYDHNQTIYFNATLRDCDNNILSGQVINATLTNETDSTINSSLLTTDSYGNIIFYFNSNYSHIGFYHINFSFNSDAYLNYSKLMSFELIPIERYVNSSDVNLQVNGVSVSNNLIQINNTNAISINSLDNTTFDLSVEILINYSNSFSYSDYMSYSFTFLASTDLTRITITDANLTTIPTNFTNYYFDSISSSNYTLTGTTIFINQAIGTTYYNDNSFRVSLRYYENSIRRIQLTTTPRTDTNNVLFREYFICNDTFSYWYLVKSQSIKSMSLTHDRTSSTVKYSDFTIEGSLYYFYKSCLEDDTFTANINYKPNWNVNYSITRNTGTEAKLEISYSADLAIENVSIIIDLSNVNMYYQDWGLNAVQSSTTYKLRIPDIDFTTATQALTIRATSPTPTASIDEIITFNKTRISESTVQYFGAYLNYSRYSQSNFIDATKAWRCYAVYYGNESYSVRRENKSTVYFESDGCDPSINDSYLFFSAKPFKDVSFDFSGTQIVINITASMNVDNCDFFRYVYIDGVHALNSDSDITDLDDQEVPYYLYFKTNISAGFNQIIINVDFQTPLETLSSTLLLFIVIGVAVGVWYYFKRNKQAQEKIVSRISEMKVVKKIKRKIEARKMKKEEEEIQKVKIVS